jgi:hypothetical protein
MKKIKKLTENTEKIRKEIEKLKKEDALWKEQFKKEENESELLKNQILSDKKTWLTIGDENEKLLKEIERNDKEIQQLEKEISEEKSQIKFFEYEIDERKKKEMDWNFKCAVLFTDSEKEFKNNAVFTYDLTTKMLWKKNGELHKQIVENDLNSKKYFGSFYSAFMELSQKLKSCNDKTTIHYYESGKKTVGRYEAWPIFEDFLEFCQKLDTLHNILEKKVVVLKELEKELLKGNTKGAIDVLEKIFIMFEKFTLKLYRYSSVLEGTRFQEVLDNEVYKLRHELYDYEMGYKLKNYLNLSYLEQVMGKLKVIFEKLQSSTSFLLSFKDRETEIFEKFHNNKHKKIEFTEVIVRLWISDIENTSSLHSKSGNISIQIGEDHFSIYPIPFSNKEILDLLNQGKLLDEYEDKTDQYKKIEKSDPQFVLSFYTLSVEKFKDSLKKLSFDIGSSWKLQEDDTVLLEDIEQFLEIEKEGENSIQWDLFKSNKNEDSEKMWTAQKIAFHLLCKMGLKGLLSDEIKDRNVSTFDDLIDCLSNAKVNEMEEYPDTIVITPISQKEIESLHDLTLKKNDVCLLM